MRALLFDEMGSGAPWRLKNGAVLAPETAPAQDNAAVQQNVGAPGDVVAPQRVPAPEVARALADSPAAEIAAAPVSLRENAAEPVEILAEPGREATIAAMGWEELEQSVAQCVACPLSENRNRTVFGTGGKHADWLFIGEAPGEEEDAQGVPFAGQAGMLLDNMLRAIGLQRGENVYITNTVKCHPPANRPPKHGEIDSCRSYLARQIEMLQPKLIVALGKVAADSLLGLDAPMSELRQKVHHYRGIALIATYHPAYLLRKLPEKARAWEDLCLAKKTMSDLQTESPAPI